jgi:hypothetical protein
MGNSGKEALFSLSLAAPLRFTFPAVLRYQAGPLLTLMVRRRVSAVSNHAGPTVASSFETPLRGSSG